METREKNVCVLPPSANRLPAKPEETRTTGGDGKFFFYLSDSFFFFVFFTIFFFYFYVRLVYPSARSSGVRVQRSDVAQRVLRFQLKYPATRHSFYRLCYRAACPTTNAINPVPFDVLCCYFIFFFVIIHRKDYCKKKKKFFFLTLIIIYVIYRETHSN